MKNVWEALRFRRFRVKFYDCFEFENQFEMKRISTNDWAENLDLKLTLNKTRLYNHFAKNASDLPIRVYLRFLAWCGSSRFFPGSVIFSLQMAAIEQQDAISYDKNGKTSHVGGKRTRITSFGTKKWKHFRLYHDICSRKHIGWFT